MKKKYVVYMKNGNKIIVSKEKYEALTSLLTQTSCPPFANIEGNVISISAISYCAVEDDPTW